MIWVDALMIFTAAAAESELWVILHCAFMYWAFKVRRNNDIINGGKAW